MRRRTQLYRSDFNRYRFTEQILDLTSGFHSWSVDLHPAGVDSRVHLQSGGELWHGVSSVLDGDGVHAVKPRDVGDGVGPVAVVLDVDFSFGSRVGADLDGELRLSGFRAVHCEGSILVDFPSLQTGPARRHLAGVKHGLDHGLEGGPGDVLVCKQDVDGVLAGLSWQVGHGAGSVTVVLAFNLGLTGSLHRQAQTTGTGALCVDGKRGRFTHNTTLKTGTVGSDLEGKQTKEMRQRKVYFDRE